MTAHHRCFVCGAVSFEGEASLLEHLSGVHRLPHSTPTTEEDRANFQQLLELFADRAELSTEIKEDEHGVQQPLRSLTSGQCDSQKLLVLAAFYGWILG